VDYDDVIDIANTCRAQGVPVILGESAGIYGRVLVDLGDNFTVYDKDGEATVEIKLDSIDADGLVTIAKPQKHSL
jgi:CO dehydrogenase/acetyl-CoA synthase alpha subunit